MQEFCICMLNRGPHKTAKLLKLNDPLSTHTHTHTQVINKADSSSKKLSDEEKHQRMVGFIESNEDTIKKFGMLRDYNAR